MPTRMPPRDNARRLRREQTDAERLLWSRLCGRQMRTAKFRRQFPIGPFVADFCSPERRLIIELDGGQHSETLARDDHRTEYLAAHGYRVLRFWNDDVLANLDTVLEAIHEFLRGALTEDDLK